MDQSTKRLEELLNRYLNDQSTEEEQIELWDYAEDPLYSEQLGDLLAAAYHLERSGTGLSAQQEQMVLNRIFYKKKKLVLWKKMVAAASILIAIGTASYFYYKAQPDPQVLIAKADINPGHYGATLTLAGGQKIRLDSSATGTLAMQAGVKISKAKNGQLIYDIEHTSADSGLINTLSTANGETYQVFLPDGTKVWLNAASSLTYNTRFSNGGTRKVRLTGEGYFEVAKDKAHPFIVQTAGQQVQVLGTHFNINSYNDELAVATTLLEGSVRVSAGQKQMVINPGQQVLNHGGELRQLNADVEHVTDWKDNEFNLDGLDFRAAMRKIARWYNVEVIYPEDFPTDMQSGGWFSRNKKLSTVLDAIEHSGQVHFKVEGRKVYVSK